MRDYGFETGKVLEPGSGVGNFIGLAPQHAEMTGVEIDSISAALSQQIYPQASIRHESFATSPFPKGYFDAAIGNVPFSPTILHDPRHNADRHSMHNHFILKSLDLTKPGGIVAVISSTGTLDAGSSKAREQMYAQADLLGAYRLPQNAFSHAGTQVMTDVLYFRKREAGQAPLSNAWVNSSIRYDEQNNAYRRNDYFDQHPENLLGTASVGTDRFGKPAEILTATTEQMRDLPQRLHNAIAADAQRHQTNGYIYNAEPSRVSEAMPLLLPDEGLVDGHISRTENGEFTIYRSGVNEELKVARTQRKELTHLLELRDQARALISAEASTGISQQNLENARTLLRENYQKYVETYGPINRYSISERADGTIVRRKPPVMSQLGKDPYGVLVMALEHFSDSTQTATPADLLNHRILHPRQPITQVDSVHDALTISLDVKGRIDPEYMGQLVSDSPQNVVDKLGESIFRIPTDNPLEPAQYQTREEYLSGNVRNKLEQAKAAANIEPAFATNVAALEKVIPEDIPSTDIHVQVGAAWIDEQIHQQFLSEVLGDTHAQMNRVHGAAWAVTGSYGYDPHGYGTERRSPAQLFQSLAEKRPIVVLSKGVLDKAQTNYAQMQAEKISEKFAQWVWEDPQRHEKLVRAYNDTFNAHALRDYSAAGQSLTLPGLVSSFTPHAHQRTAVARMIHEPSVGLFHEVGAGKTAEMVMGSMELKRLGLVNKPAVLVPNHMLEQFSREWLSMYPQAKILAASSSDIGVGAKRQEFVARVAANDWDAVILTHSAFEKISLSPESQARYREKEVALMRQSLRSYLDRAGAEEYSGRTAKQFEAAIEREEEKIKALLDSPKDSGISFEETGIDYLCVDEMHEFKNLRTFSHIPDANIAGSEKASNLHMVIEYLRSEHGNRVVTAATGTPLANSMTEMYVMNRFLAPELLRQQGIEDFDSWAATYGKTVTQMELTVAGGDSYKMNTRFAQFVNVPELIRTLHTFGDVKLAEDLEYLKRPEMMPNEKGEKAPSVLSLERSDTQAQYIQTLADRYQNLSGQNQPGEDNALLITSDGRKAAADFRLIDPSYVPDGSALTKTQATAELLAQVYEENKDTVYKVSGTDENHPTPGALQVVFCDYGVPNNEGKFDMYADLKQHAVEAGIPAEKIRFVHEATTDAKKAKLFQQCRSGEVAVLIGSTQKMGVGTNIQDRLVHLVHMDAPWRPADIDQRNGRILRPGNQNPQVKITQVVTKETFDAVMWSVLLRKQKFISQVMRGSMTERTMEDIGDSAVSMAQTQAIATGNPFIMEHAEALKKVEKLRHAEQGFHNEKRKNQWQLSTLKQRAQSLQEQLPQMKNAASEVVSTAGDQFSATVAGTRFEQRTDAVQALKKWAETIGSPSHMRHQDLGKVMTLGGLSWVAEMDLAKSGHLLETPLRFSVEKMPWVKVEVSFAEAKQMNRGVLTRMENVVSGVHQRLENMQEELEGIERAIPELEEKLNQSFERATQLEVAKAEEKRLADLVEKFKRENSGGKNKPATQNEQSSVDIVAAYEPESTEKNIPNNSKEQKRMEQPYDTNLSLMRVDELKGELEYWQENPYSPNDFDDTESYRQLREEKIQALRQELDSRGEDVVQKVTELSSRESDLKEEISSLERAQPGVLAQVHQAKSVLESVENEGKDLERRLEERVEAIASSVDKDYQKVLAAQREVDEAGFLGRGRKKEELAKVKEEFAQRHHGAENVEGAVEAEVQTDAEVSALKAQLANHDERESEARQVVSDAVARRDSLDFQASAARQSLRQVQQKKSLADPKARIARLKNRLQGADNKVQKPRTQETQVRRGLEK